MTSIISITYALKIGIKPSSKSSLKINNLLLRIIELNSFPVNYYDIYYFFKKDNNSESAIFNKPRKIDNRYI